MQTLFDFDRNISIFPKTVSIWKNSARVRLKVLLWRAILATIKTVRVTTVER